MSILSLPGWIIPHLYTNRNYSDLSDAELDDLRAQLSIFKNDKPDVSVIIPAWNEENNIYRALSSLASNKTNLKVELIVVNNNSTDGTQAVLDRLGVKSVMQTLQGTPFARQIGLDIARGKYHLCADADTLYPPRWIDLMCKPMIQNPTIVGVYGRYSFIPPQGDGRFILWFYERLTGVLVRLRKFNREHINVLGFTMGFVTELGRIKGFNVKEVRVFDNQLDSEYFVEEAEDGRMALNLMEFGKLKLVTHPGAVVFTSSRRLTAEGGLLNSFTRRVKLHLGRINEYVRGEAN